MANLAITSYVIEGNRTSIEALHNQFKKVLATDRSEFENQRGTYLPDSSWLGYVVKDILQLDYDKDNVYCRGTICFLDDKITIKGDNSAFFRLETETAWSDQRKMFYLISEKFNVEIHFITEELAMGIWEKTEGSEKWFPESYLLDDSEDDMYYFDTFDEFAEAIKDLCGEKPEKYGDTDEILIKHDLDERVYVHQIEYTSLSNF